MTGWWVNRLMDEKVNRPRDEKIKGPAKAWIGDPFSTFALFHIYTSTRRER
jgi:hypothetical protein